MVFCIYSSSQDFLVLFRVFFSFTARTLLCVVWSVSKHNGKAVWHFTSFSAPAQQASSQCHSSSDCKLHQTAHMLKVRQCKSASNHFCWGWADMRDNGVYFHHDHLKERWRETAPWRWTDIVVLDQLGCEIFPGVTGGEKEFNCMFVWFFSFYIAIHNHINIYIREWACSKQSQMLKLNTKAGRWWGHFYRIFKC